MNKSKISFIFSLLLTSIVSLTSCDFNIFKKKKFEYDHSNFFGICALNGETGRLDAYDLNIEWTKDRIQAMGFKSQRFWIGLCDMFEFDENDEIRVKQAEYESQKEFVTACTEAGVRNCLVQISGYITPYGTHYDNSYSTPDPETEPDLYQKWLICNAKACAKLKELFPEFTIFETGNEPDFDNSTCIHKDGFIWNGDYAANANYLYNDEVKASIICDLCWYIRKYVREVDPNAKVTIPGLTNLDTVNDFLDTIYCRIESKRLPFGQKYSDTDPDNYFDYLNWHPYSKVSPQYGPLDEEWVEFNKNLYQVAIDHGDEGKQVLFSEFGWCTLNNKENAETENNNLIAQLVRDGVQTILKELPWVHSIYYFRLSNIYNPNNIIPAQDTWGLFYHPVDPNHLGAPRPQAVALAKEINGENYVLEDHLKPVSELNY